jgi:hypothetical protein
MNNNNETDLAQKLTIAYEEIDQLSTQLNETVERTTNAEQLLADLRERIDQETERADIAEKRVQYLEGELQRICEEK